MLACRARSEEASCCWLVSTRLVLLVSTMPLYIRSTSYIYCGMYHFLGESKTAGGKIVSREGGHIV